MNRECIWREYYVVTTLYRRNTVTSLYRRNTVFLLKILLRNSSFQSFKITRLRLFNDRTSIILIGALIVTDRTTSDTIIYLSRVRVISYRSIGTIDRWLARSRVRFRRSVINLWAWLSAIANFSTAHRGDQGATRGQPRGNGYVSASRSITDAPLRITSLSV